MKECRDMRRQVQWRNIRTLAEKLKIQVPARAEQNSRYETVLLNIIPDGVIERVIDEEGIEKVVDEEINENIQS